MDFPNILVLVKVKTKIGFFFHVREYKTLEQGIILDIHDIIILGF